jgi:hypothetical protein
MPLDGTHLVIQIIFNWNFQKRKKLALSVSLIAVFNLLECTGKLLKEKELPEEEKNFQKNYVKAPSFLSIHMGVKASVLPAGTDCHHFVLEVCHTVEYLSLTSVAFSLYDLFESMIGRIIGIIWKNPMEAYF